MTGNKAKAAMRYAARIACIYDWTASGETARTAERLGKADCVEAMRALGAFISSGSGTREQERTDADRLWSQTSGEFPGIGVKDIREADRWAIPELVRVYDMQAREIRAAVMLRERFLAGGADLNGTAQRNNVYKWEFAGWMDFGNRIPWLMVLAVESLEASGRSWGTDDAFRERDRIRREYANAAGVKED